MKTESENQINAVTGSFNVFIDGVSFISNAGSLRSYPINTGSNRFVWSVEAVSSVEHKNILLTFPATLEGVTDAKFEVSNQMDSDITAFCTILITNSEYANRYRSESGSLTVTYSKGAVVHHFGSFDFIAKSGDKIVTVSGNFDLTGQTSANARPVDR